MLDVLLLATGFTGALTAVYLARLALRKFVVWPGVIDHGADRGPALAGALDAAHSEVLWHAATPPAGEALAALGRCKERAVEVVVLIGPAADKDAAAVQALLDRHVEPLVAAEHAAALTPFAVVDGRTVLVGNLTAPPSEGDAPDAAPLLVVRGVPALAAAYRTDFAAHRAGARKSQVRPAASTATPRPTPAPVPAAA